MGFRLFGMEGCEPDDEIEVHEAVLPDRVAENGRPPEPEPEPPARKRTAKK